MRLRHYGLSFAGLDGRGLGREHVLTLLDVGMSADRRHRIECRICACILLTDCVLKEAFEVCCAEIRDGFLAFLQFILATESLALLTHSEFLIDSRLAKPDLGREKCEWRPEVEVSMTAGLCLK